MKVFQISHMPACQPYLVTEHPMLSLARLQVLFRKGHQGVAPLLAPEGVPQLLGVGRVSFQRRGRRAPDTGSSRQAFQAETEHRARGSLTHRRVSERKRCLQWYLSRMLCPCHTSRPCTRAHGTDAHRLPAPRRRAGREHCV